MTGVDGLTAFWIVVAVMTAAAVCLLLRAMRRGPPLSDRVSRDAANAAVHRGDLAALDTALVSGALSESEHRTATDDILRRILAEATASPPAPSARTPGRALHAGIAVVVPALAMALYLAVGNPHAINEMATAVPIAGLSRNDLPAAALQLEQHLARDPRDGRAWVILARVSAELGRFGAAAAAYERGLSVSAKVAQDPMVWCELVDALGMTQGRSLMGRPRELIEKALSLDNAHPRALEMAGSAEYEAGHYARAAAYWAQLLGRLEPGTPSHRELSAAIARSERLALLQPR